MYRPFTPDSQELNQLMKQALAAEHDSLVSSIPVQTGWTNITMDVQGEQRDYIFRFPRTLFFAEQMIKDCMVCRFLQDKISLPIPKMQLRIDKGRPFSMHPKIKGETLAQKMPLLSGADKQKIALNLALFLQELQRIPLQTVPAMMKKSLNQFLVELAGVHKGNYDFSKHQAWQQIEQHSQELCLVHGDFHPGNILIDSQNQVAGIIDFAFASVSDRHADIGRFVGRFDDGWQEMLMQAYKTQTRQSLDENKIRTMARLFQYVDCSYVAYMKRAHPEIIIPDSLRQKEK